MEKKIEKSDLVFFDANAEKFPPFEIFWIQPVGHVLKLFIIPVTGVRRYETRTFAACHSISFLNFFLSAYKWTIPNSNKSYDVLHSIDMNSIS